MEVDTEYIEVKRSILTKSILPKCFSDLNISIYNLPQKKIVSQQQLPLFPQWKIKNLEGNIGNIGNNNILKRNDGFYILANKVNISKHLKKTKFCNIFIQEGTCNRKICNFAHSVDEFNFPCCAFGNNCKINNCKFKHPCERLDDYKTRINFEVPQNIK
jgi:hypothetical protein